MEDTGASYVHEDEDQVDGCTSDVEFDESDALSDTELPLAAGGVQAADEEHGDEDGIDGCDADFNGTDATTDKELPIAVGGMLEMMPSWGA
jgi:hypothetical protein